MDICLNFDFQSANHEFVTVVCTIGVAKNTRKLFRRHLRLQTRLLSFFYQSRKLILNHIQRKCLPALRQNDKNEVNIEVNTLKKSFCSIGFFFILYKLAPRCRALQQMWKLAHYLLQLLLCMVGFFQTLIHF
jgi:hypothetical protein